MKINSLTIIGLLINTLITAFIYFSEEYKYLDLFMIIALAICYLGFIIMLFKQAKIGSIIFSIGSVAFIPIGIVGIIGVKRTVGQIEEEKFIKTHYD